MFLWIALGISLIFGLLSPFAKRLQATGLWAGKVLVEPELAEALPTGFQDALTDGWPSWIGFLTASLPFCAIILGFVHAWWGGLIAFLASVVMGEIVDRTHIAPQSLERYLAHILAHTHRRQADFSAKGDNERADAARSLASDVEDLLRLYIGSKVPAPTMRQAKQVQFGDRESLLMSKRNLS